MMGLARDEIVRVCVAVTKCDDETSSNFIRDYLRVEDLNSCGWYENCEATLSHVTVLKKPAIVAMLKWIAKK